MEDVMKVCSKCKTEKELSEFFKNKARYDGLCNYCKTCDYKKSRNNRENHLKAQAKWYIKNKKREQIKRNEYRKNNLQVFRANTAKYKAAKIQRTPTWANLNKIKEIYQTCPEGYHVDHIVPLQGNNVSGLHVEYNLQYLTPEENLKKSNKLLDSEGSL